MPKEMLWVVTGGAGYIGSHVSEQLLSAGYPVLVFDDLSTGLKKFIPKTAEFVEGSVLNGSDVKKCMETVKSFGMNFGVIHIAGVKLPSESMIHPEKYFRINTFGTLEFVDAAMKNGALAIVFSSTCSVYGNVGEIAVSETRSTSPESIYAKSKLQAETILFDLSRAHKVSVAALRYFNVVGTDHNHIRDLSRINLFPAVVDSLSGVRALTIHGTELDTRDGTCVRDYLHVGDLARAHVLAAEWILNFNNSREVFNLGSGVGATVLEVVSEFERQSASSVPYILGPPRVGDPASITADASKALRLLGWKATRPMSEMVKSVLHQDLPVEV